MRATFSGIEIARRALRAQQRSLDVTAHNIANANTPGYSRQVAVHTSSQPYTVPQMGGGAAAGQVGTGVIISEVHRVQDEYVETRLRQEQHNLSYWNTMKDHLHQVELIVNEPSESGLHQTLEAFWDSIQQLHKTPESESARAVVTQRGEALAETTVHMRTQLALLRRNLNDTIGIRVQEINALAEQIASLNTQIGKVVGTGSNPNDLLDKRGVLLADLAELTAIDVVQDHSGMVSVAASGVTLVHRGQWFGMDTKTAAGSDYGKLELVQADSANPITADGGELAALMDLRDQDVQWFIDALDEWAQDFMVKFNAVHRSGYDLDGAPGGDFFTGFGNHAALNMAVDAAVAAEPRALAAGSEPGYVGNGENARQLASLRYLETTAFASELEAYQAYLVEQGDPLGSQQAYFDRLLETESPADEFNSRILSPLGVNTQKASWLTSNQQELTQHLANLRESISGVSLDEEMANMIRFQHAYTAAARVMTAYDEGLETVINRMGLVGR